MMRYDEVIKSKQHWYDLPVAQAKVLAAMDQGYATVEGITNNFELDEDNNCRCPLCSVHDDL